MVLHVNRSFPNSSAGNQAGPHLSRHRRVRFAYELTTECDPGTCCYELTKEIVADCWWSNEEQRRNIENSRDFFNTKASAIRRLIRKVEEVYNDIQDTFTLNDESNFADDLSPDLIIKHSAGLQEWAVRGHAVRGLERSLSRRLALARREMACEIRRTVCRMSERVGAGNQEEIAQYYMNASGTIQALIFARCIGHADQHAAEQVHNEAW